MVQTGRVTLSLSCYCFTYSTTIMPSNLPTPSSSFLDMTTITTHSAKAASAFLLGQRLYTALQQFFQYPNYFWEKLVEAKAAISGSFALFVILQGEQKLLWSPDNIDIYCRSSELMRFWQYFEVEWRNIRLLECVTLIFI